MIATKIFNNNSIVSMNDKGEEIILVGGGIGFGIRKNDEIDERKIEKVFCLEKETNYKFQSIVRNTPLQYILAADQIITYIKKNSSKKINDFIYVTLTDHIYTTIERVKNHIEFDQVLLTNVKNLYHEEYILGLDALKVLQSRLHINIPDSEANFIALHIINAEMNCSMPMIYEITSTIAEIAHYVSETLHTEQNTISFDRFMTHCRFLIQRIFNKNEDEVNNALFENILTDIEKAHTEELNCVEHIMDIIKEKCQYEINEDEKMYLMIHLIRLKNSKYQNRQ